MLSSRVISKTMITNVSSTRTIPAKAASIPTNA
jgi:hypothetical protein